MSDIFVIDASAVGRFFLKDEKNRDWIEPYAKDAIDGKISLYAPRLVITEAFNMFVQTAKNSKRPGYTWKDADKSCDDFWDLKIKFKSMPRVKERCRTMVKDARRYRLSYCDAIYFMLVWRLEREFEIKGIPLITADKKHIRACKSVSIPYVSPPDPD